MGETDKEEEQIYMSKDKAKKLKGYLETLHAITVLEYHETYTLDSGGPFLSGDLGALNLNKQDLIHACLLALW